MSKTQLLVSVALLTAVAQISFAPAGIAQGGSGTAAQPTTTNRSPAPSIPRAPANASAPNAQDANTTTPGGEQDGSPGGGNADAGAVRRSPVQVITGIEVFQSSLRPPMDVIRVTGLAPSSGWSDPELVVIGTGTPSDGILDVMLAASAPAENADADGFIPLEAILPIEAGHPFKGVRVRSATNALTLRQLPGHIEGQSTAEDCSHCVGKLFVAKGQAAPVGSDAIKEESLPPGTLVIKPTDGVAQTLPDPNRLTLVLGDDGRIVQAFWN